MNVVLPDHVRAEDLRDLDMLDDAARHAKCIICYPMPQELGKPFIAWCGRRAVWLIRLSDDLAIPPDACRDCLSRPECPAGHGSQYA